MSMHAEAPKALMPKSDVARHVSKAIDNLLRCALAHEGGKPTTARAALYTARMECDALREILWPKAKATPPAARRRPHP